jgi:hypothetical protein
LFLSPSERQAFPLITAAKPHRSDPDVIFELELGEQARARVAEYFEIGKVVQMYEAFYEELADDGHRNEVNATQ